VDDESGILDSLNILLRNEGFVVHLAHGGKAGLERLAELSPDIVLTDIRMPNVSGVEILAAARLSDPDMPVILMTAQATLQSAMQAVNEGAFYYIQKPFRNDELVAILRRAAEHRNLRVENKSLKQRFAAMSGGASFVRSARARRGRHRASRGDGGPPITVLIQGDQGWKGSRPFTNFGAFRRPVHVDQAARSRRVSRASCSTCEASRAHSRPPASSSPPPRARSSSTKSERRRRRRR
jgi:DNA-binding NtrC family response regulator